MRICQFLFQCWINVSVTSLDTLYCVLGEFSEFATEFVIAYLLLIVAWNNLRRSLECNCGAHFVAIGEARQENVSVDPVSSHFLLCGQFGLFERSSGIPLSNYTQSVFYLVSAGFCSQVGPICTHVTKPRCGTKLGCHYQQLLTQSRYITMSLCYYVTTSNSWHQAGISLCHYVTMSLCHYVITSNSWQQAGISLCCYVTMSLPATLDNKLGYHYVTMSLPATLGNKLGYHYVTMSLCQYVTMSLCHYQQLLTTSWDITMSLCHYVITSNFWQQAGISLSLCHYVITSNFWQQAGISLCHYVTMSLCHYVTMSLPATLGVSFCQARLTTSKSSTTHSFEFLLKVTLHYITLHYIALHYITLHYITLHYITLHYIGGT